MNSYIFVYGVEIDKFEAKNYEINAATLCLSSVPKDFSVDDMKSNWIRFDNIWDIHEYLMKKHNLK